MNATLSRPRPLAPLSTRRRIVALTFGGYALLLLSGALQSLGILSDLMYGALFVMGVLVFFINGIRLMKPSSLGLPEGKDRQLDERQWHQIARAHVVAYRSLGALFLLVAFYFWLVSQNHHLPTPSDSSAWVNICIGASVLIPALPTAILAWTEPDITE